MLPLLTGAGAIFDPSQQFRYVLWRNFTQEPIDACLWVMLNPSTATAEVDDPTVRRCQGFSRAWGFDSCRVVNIFAYRSTDPRALVGVPDPVGPENDAYLSLEAAAASRIICAWGVNGQLFERSASVRSLLAPFECWCFGLTKNLEPLHPLYQPSTKPLTRWS